MVDTGSARTVAYKKETTWGTIATATGAKTLRRITSGLGFTKDNFQSSEITANFQPRGTRHGTRRVSGDLNGHAILKDYEEFYAASLRKDFAAVTTITPTDLTTTTSTIVRATGSWITDGVKVGMVVRLALQETANQNKNFRVTAVTATVITVAETLTLQATPDADAQLVIPGKISFNPASAHTSDSFSVEHYHAGSDQSDIFLGCRVGNMNLQLPPDGIGQVTFGMVGKDFQANDTGAAPYFTSPAAVGTGQELAAPEGSIRIGGVDQAILTGLNISLDLGLSGDPVIGSNLIPDTFYDVPNLSGQITVFRQDQVFLNNFINEDEIEIHAMLPGFGTAPVGFLSVLLPKVKFTSWSMPDDAKGLVQTFDFTATQKTGDTSYNSSAIQIQDSELV